jgi:NAD-dependent DNA ligase
MAWSAANAVTATSPINRPSGGSGSSSNGPTFTVVLTGFRDKALEATLVATGHTIADTVTKKTTHVVHPDGPTPTSTKITKARDAGVVVMSVSEFKARVPLSA